MKKYLLILTVVLAFAACSHEDDPKDDDTDACKTSSVTYSTTVTGILADYNCLGCHSASTANILGGDNLLDSYDAVKAHADRGALVGVLTNAAGYEDKQMPQPPSTPGLDSCEVVQIQAWVAAGAPNN